MEVIADKSFERDFKKLPDNIKQSASKVYIELVEAKSLNDISYIKKLSGHKNYYRIKINDYRLGFYIAKNTI